MPSRMIYIMIILNFQFKRRMLVELFFENSQRIKPVNEVRKNVFSQVYDKIPSTPRFCTTENFCSVSSTSFTS